MNGNEKAKRAADQFIEQVKKGAVIKDTLPNSFENYTDFYEEADLESYKSFIRTLTYTDYIAARKVMYHGE